MQKTVHFKVDFDGMTRHIRDLWSEGSYWKCVETLDALGVPRRYWPNVIDGSMKLTQDPNGIIGTDGILAVDTWKPVLANCHYQKYPKFDALSRIFAQQQKWSEKYLDTAYVELSALWKEYQRTQYNGKKLSEILLWIKTYPKELLDLVGVDIPQILFESEYNSIVDKFEVDVDSFVKKQQKLWDTELSPDKEFARPLGWVLPTGVFYSCEHIEHDIVATKLGNSQHFNSDYALKAGWIKITHPLGEPTDYHVVCEKEPTQKQIDTMYDWTKVYGTARFIERVLDWDESYGPLST